ncbi:MAG: hypothetical protein ISP91_08630 [Pseudomonadales bacterium]|nr:hypothetical protein [Pseudomonadales bacterium]
MNLKKIIVTGTLLLASQVHGEEIVLEDGSRINGKVLSMTGGSYQVQTESMGVITIDKGKILSISQGSQPAISSDSAMQAGQSAVQNLQTSIASDQRLMTSIRQLQSDPDMQAVLSDPELMRAVQSFDLQTLQNHPKIKKLMNNSNVQSIQQRVSP